MKPWKRALINTIGYSTAFFVGRLFFKNSIDLTWAEGLILVVFAYMLNFLLWSALDYANKK